MANYGLTSFDANIDAEFTALCRKNGVNITDAQALRDWEDYLEVREPKLSKTQIPHWIDVAKRAHRKERGFGDDVDIPSPPR